MELGDTFPTVGNLHHRHRSVYHYIYIYIYIYINHCTVPLNLQLDHFCSTRMYMEFTDVRPSITSEICSFLISSLPFQVFMLAVLLS